MAPKKTRRKKAKKPARKAKAASKKKAVRKKKPAKPTRKSSRTGSGGAALRRGPNKHGTAHSGADALGEWPETGEQPERGSEFSEDDIPPEYGGSE